MNWALPIIISRYKPCIAKGIKSLLPHWAGKAQSVSEVNSLLPGRCDIFILTQEVTL